jgi:hypothetical protein
MPKREAVDSEPLHQEDEEEKTTEEYREEGRRLLNTLLEKDIEECKRIWAEEAFLFEEWVDLELPWKEEGGRGGRLGFEIDELVGEGGRSERLGMEAHFTTEE